MNPEMIPPNTEAPGTMVWRLWRQDIHGNQYRMPSEFESQEAAEEVRDTYEAKGHHQHYVVKPSAPNDTLDFIPSK